MKRRILAEGYPHFSGDGKNIIRVGITDKPFWRIGHAFKYKKLNGWDVKALRCRLVLEYNFCRPKSKPNKKRG